MIFDLTYFGYGVGLVMFGWVLGFVVGIVISAISKLDNIW